MLFTASLLCLLATGFAHNFQKSYDSYDSGSYGTGYSSGYGSSLYGLSYGGGYDDVYSTELGGSGVYSSGIGGSVDTGYTSYHAPKYDNYVPAYQRASVSYDDGSYKPYTYSVSPARYTTYNRENIRPQYKSFGTTYSKNPATVSFTKEVAKPQRYTKVAPVVVARQEPSFPTYPVAQVKEVAPTYISQPAPIVRYAPVVRQPEHVVAVQERPVLTKVVQKPQTYTVVKQPEPVVAIPYEAPVVRSYTPVLQKAERYVVEAPIVKNVEPVVVSPVVSHAPSLYKSYSYPSYNSYPTYSYTSGNYPSYTYSSPSLINSYSYGGYPSYSSGGYQSGYPSTSYGSYPKSYSVVDYK